MARKARMSGRVLQNTIIELAEMYGWRVAHFPSVLVTGRDGKSVYRTAVNRGGRGFPDLVLCRPQDMVMFVEVKGDGDTLRPEQEAWIADLTEVAEVRVWTPKELESGEIMETLTR